MKKWIIPALLFLAVLLVSWLAQPYTLICQEYEGLFLATPDAWARAFSQPLPLSGIVSDFLIQFYREPFYGALVSAVLVTAVFLLGRAILSRFGLALDLVPALGAAVLWFFLAQASEPKMGVAALFILVLLWLLSLLFPRRKAVTWKADLYLSAAIVLAAAALVVFNPKIQRTERFSRVKRDALYGVWDDLLRTVPPAVAEKDPELTPFALLALSGKGELQTRMFHYPVYDENDLDMLLYDGKTEYYTSLLFKACLYQFLGCYNESIHNYYQWATQLSKGTSFVVLRRLVEMYYLLGDYALMEKYCRILDHSLMNGRFVHHFRTLASQVPPREPDSPQERAKIPVITHDPFYNLLLLESNGFDSPMARERIPATLMFRNNQ
ncbi:MAG: hypothetical protein J5669_02085 [Bacteroidales bacterium]|nr:hypothetical protein [Bacteroidales bacterium]